MGKSTISMVIFNSYVKLPEGNWLYHHLDSPKNTLQFFPDLPHMNHRISIDLANKKNPTPTWKVCHKISHHGMPPTHSWDLGFLQSIGRVPGAVVGRPLWASSSSADWWLPGIGDPNIAIFGDPTGIEMDFTKKRCCRKICWRFDEILPSQIGFVPKLFQKWCSRTCFERRTYRKSPIWGGRHCCRCSRKSL